jgi:phosphopantothenoylcysteine decarboxylase/phosphopantothenate--cysteine ligase
LFPKINGKLSMAKKILLIITGSIAAYKSIDLIRILKKNNYEVNCILTKSAEEFITPLAVASISASPVYTDLFSLKDEAEMGHIRLSREADFVVVAPASADIIGKMANGLANDLASTVLMATDKKVMVVPAMNVKMWENRALQRNIAQIKQDGAIIVGPGAGELACGEFGQGRMLEPDAIFAEIERFFN